MNRFRKILSAIALVALAVTIVCLWGAAIGRVDWMRYATTPLLVVVFASWWVALATATRIAEAESSTPIPGLKQFVGMWFAIRQAPLWAISVSAMSLLSLLFLGASGSLNGLPTTPHEAQIAGSGFVVFLALSVPELLTRHPAANTAARSNTSLERTRER
jgi:hypothetical protein